MTDGRDSMFYGWGFAEWLGVGLLALVTSLLLTVLVLCARADGRADFCYIGGTKATEGKPRLYWYAEAHRPWRPDVNLGYFDTQAEAIAAARTAECRLYTEAR